MRGTALYSYEELLAARSATYACARPPITRNQVELMEVDNVTSADAPAFFGPGYRSTIAWKRFSQQS